MTTVGDLGRNITALFGGRLVTPEALELMREVYLSAGEATVGSERVYAEAGAGDFGLGGVAVSPPNPTRA